MTTVTLSTPLLRVGDIIREHGMRVRITGPARVVHHGCDWSNVKDLSMHVDGYEPKCRLVYAWPGQVLNVDEVRAAGIVPGYFLYDHERQTHGPGHGREDAWNVQGNDLARWCVERSEP